MNQDAYSVLHSMDISRAKRYINIFISTTKTITGELDFFQVFQYYIETRKLTSDGYRLISLSSFKDFLVEEYVIKDMVVFYQNHLEKRKILG